MRFFRQTRGVIMMETLITLPIYIVILAGLFWLGDTSISRLASIDGENYTLWNYANRHGTPSGPYLFWFLDTEGEATARAGIRSSGISSSSDQAYSWGRITRGRLEGSIKRSGWSWGAAESVRAYYSETETAEPSGKEYLDLFARRKGGDVVILSRCGDGSRSGDISYNGTEGASWYYIAYSGWSDFFMPDSAGSAYNISEYTRDRDFVLWSR